MRRTTCIGGVRGAHVDEEEPGEVEQRVVAVAEHLADHEGLGLAIAHHPVLPAEVLEPAGSTATAELSGLHYR